METTSEKEIGPDAMRILLEALDIGLDVVRDNREEDLRMVNYLRQLSPSRIVVTKE